MMSYVHYFTTFPKERDNYILYLIPFFKNWVYLVCRRLRYKLKITAIYNSFNKFNPEVTQKIMNIVLHIKSKGNSWLNKRYLEERRKQFKDRIVNLYQWTSLIQGVPIKTTDFDIALISPIYLAEIRHMSAKSKSDVFIGTPCKRDKLTRFYNSPKI